VCSSDLEIRNAVKVQEQLGLDVLVHGEAERNDMVEYFAEQLDGYAFTRFGWVQSYGSRCVKPAIIFGDLSRPKAMTVDWISYAQQQTDKVMKGMLTGPVTMLMWSFPREDISREQQARQLALAIRDEVTDLEAAGIRIIQIDEAAFREGLPLRRSGWQGYLDWATEAFRLTASGVRDETQIHTHMCYSEFNDVIESIAAMDADVITIETSRSDMELLEAFEQFAYPNEVGPGVYDIHSPRVPSTAQMVSLLRKAAQQIPAQRLWVNPDCGLKTRAWRETREALANMVAAARELRAAGRGLIAAGCSGVPLRRRYRESDVLAVTAADEFRLHQPTTLVDHQGQHKEEVAQHIAHARQQHGHLFSFLIDPDHDADGLFAGGAGQMQLRNRWRASGKHEAVQALGYFCLVMVKALLQPGLIFLADGQPATDRAVDMKGQRLDLLKVSGDIRHVLGQVGDDGADMTAQLIGDDLEVAQRRAFVHEGVTHLVNVLAELKGHGMLPRNDDRRIAVQVDMSIDLESLLQVSAGQHLGGRPQRQQLTFMQQAPAVAVTGGQ